jgi:hypothetical protein
MVVLAAPFSQVSGHLLPFQTANLNPSPVDQGLLVAKEVNDPAVTQFQMPIQVRTIVEFIGSVRLAHQ